MATARSKLLCPEVTPYYHCVSRCVRRSYLCGYDQLSGKSYEHRRAWVEQKMLSLAAVYCIDICSYSVMNNHYHLVAHVNRESAAKLSEREVIDRWCSLHKMPLQIYRFIEDNNTNQSERKQCLKIIKTWRERLYSLSWFMKELNHHIAVQANKEDDCTGRFWEGRFKSQALLDEKALISAMAYVDLNPIRANIASKPENSRYTSVYMRLKQLAKNNQTPPNLAAFIGNKPQSVGGIPFLLRDYLELVDWVGKQLKVSGKGFIDNAEPPILQRLALEPSECLSLATQLEDKVRNWIGTKARINDAKLQLNRKRLAAFEIS